MRLECLSFADGAWIPAEFAMGVPAEGAPATFGANRNPHLRWSGAPAGTKSFALIVHDPDVPSVGDDVNQSGRTVPHDLPRVDFFHWVMVDIPADIDELPEGCDCEGITAGGKDYGLTPYGRRGINSYTAWFAGDSEMGGHYGGYDGPFPPWNDERLHHYHFTLYALDVESLGLDGPFDGEAARRAMERHILAQAEWLGLYALNPEVRARH